MVIGVTEKQAGGGLVHYQPDVTADTHRPEVFVFGLVKLVQAHARIDRVHLQVERGGFDELLLVAGELGEAVSKRVSYAEININ